MVFGKLRGFTSKGEGLGVRKPFDFRCKKITKIKTEEGLGTFRSPFLEMHLSLSHHTPRILSLKDLKLWLGRDKKLFKDLRVVILLP